MAITAVSVAPLIPIIELLTRIIGYLTELHKNSKKQSETLAQIKNGLAQVKKMLEGEIEARNADRALTRKLVFGVGALAFTPWIYIALHLAGLIR